MRAIIIVLDGAGVGATPDAQRYGDAGANTLGHVLSSFPDLKLPTLRLMGLGRILHDGAKYSVNASYGRMRPSSAGKDGRSGHWELGGVVLDESLAGAEENYTRTPRTVLNAIREAGLTVTSIGKSSKSFAGSGISESYAAGSNSDVMCRIDAVWRIFDSGLVFADLSDFDACGHRRDVAGFARALAEFDLWLGFFLRSCAREDLVIVTAGHGNDPTFTGTDHTREEVPLMVWHGGLSRELGCRDSFADVASALSAFFGLASEWPAKSASRKIRWRLPVRRWRAGSPRQE